MHCAAELYVVHVPFTSALGCRPSAARRANRLYISNNYIVPIPPNVSNCQFISAAVSLDAFAHNPDPTIERPQPMACLPPRYKHTFATCATLFETFACISLPLTYSLCRAREDTATAISARHLNMSNFPSQQQCGQTRHFGLTV